jgi:HD-GYP domain-containing protein (c-di-GMP phosphodiesterase class II)
MEAVAGWLGEESDHDLGARSRRASGESDVLRRVAALACRVAGADGAAVVLRGRTGPLAICARHGRCGTLLAQTAIVKRALAQGRAVTKAKLAAAPLMVDGEARGALTVSGLEFDALRLDLLTDLAGLAAGSLLESDRRVRAEAALEAGADVLARAVEMRDAYTGQHSVQVSLLARRVGERIGMSAEDVDLLGYAARLHDVGKLAVPDAILQKPGPLDELEWAVMRCHPAWGADMVAGVPGLERLAELVGAHHERWDGGGYPHGIEGEQIPLASRVIAACDAFEAMVSDRPYRAPLEVKDALGQLKAGAGSQFDPMVVVAVEVELAAAA